ncbi:TetR/AcrR family transcriptional regulator [Franzmannia qiaohouensis]|uniref:TetR family transcriptional regulator n=1 Tax=Franzmannia qiaohouensis TaxID=1329370 RepID=A0ABU1HBP9_9GAMM|nr:TetR family transcriptional regulator [Halomonas qiaohouensis]MDR5904897.1 TetR family transcriptional regulator [Halomonas qiaohouensis]
MTRGRPIAFSPDQATSAAMQVFWARGYDSASTRDLLDAMQISRSSLYQAYGNKEQLFLEAMRRYRDNLLVRLAKRSEAAPSALAFIEGLFLDTAAEAGSERAALGCLIFNSAGELGQREGLAAEEARRSLDAITALFQQVIVAAQRQGDIDAQRDSKALATYLTMGMAGLRTLLKSTQDRAATQAAATMFLASLR